MTRSIHTGFAGLIALALTPALSACEDETPPLPANTNINDGDNAVTNDTPGATDAIIVSNDLTLQTAIERELKLDPILGGDVAVTVKEGVAQLAGEVDSALAKRRATDIALSVYGIRSVSNRLVVPATDMNDEEVARDVMASLAREPATADLRIGVKVQDGEVTLSGDVSSWQEQELALDIARSRRGVRSVEDDLEIDLLEPRTAIDLRTDVVSRLKWDVMVDEEKVDVDVDGSVVTLRGSVRHAAARRRAIRDAYVRGVTVVDASDLLVTPWAAYTGRVSPEEAIASDVDIATAIKDAMSVDPRLSPHAVNPQVNYGVVNLTGKVATRSAVDIAEEIARSTKGVRIVVNRIEVVPAAERSDEEIAKSIDAALLGSSLVRTDEVKVAVDDHVATLTGDVPSFFDKARIERLVSDVVGVFDVKNALAVDNEEHRVTRDAFDVGSVAIFNRDYFEFAPRVDWVESDEELLSAVRSELYWDPKTPLETIRVSEADGTVTLKGTVPHWWQSSRATTDAYQAGAKRVDNQLDILFQGPVKHTTPGAPTLMPDSKLEK